MKESPKEHLRPTADRGAYFLVNHAQQHARVATKSTSFHLLVASTVGNAAEHVTACVIAIKIEST
jgi:hypothetical protein